MSCPHLEVHKGEVRDSANSTLLVVKISYGTGAIKLLKN